MRADEVVDAVAERRPSPPSSHDDECSCCWASVCRWTNFDEDNDE